MQTSRKLESAGKVNQRGIRQNLRLRAQAPKKRTDRLSVALFNKNLHGARDSAPAHVKHPSDMLRIRTPKTEKKQHQATRLRLSAIGQKRTSASVALMTRNRIEAWHDSSAACSQRHDDWSGDGAWMRMLRNSAPAIAQTPVPHTTTLDHVRDCCMWGIDSALRPRIVLKHKRDSSACQTLSRADFALRQRHYQGHGYKSA